MKHNINKILNNLKEPIVTYNKCRNEIKLLSLSYQKIK